MVYVISRKSGEAGQGYGLLKGKGKSVALDKWGEALKTAARKRQPVILPGLA